MFEGITFIDVCNDSNSEGSFCVAVKDLEESKFFEIESAVLDAAEQMTHYDSMEDIIRGVMDETGLEYEIVYPDRFISVD